MAANPAVEGKSHEALQTPSAFSSDAVSQVSQALNVALADTFALYLKTKNFHWHVSGPHFRDYHELFDDEHVAVVPPSHRWADRAFVTPEELAGEQLYLYSRSIDNSFIIQKVMRPLGIEPRRVTYLQLTEGIIEMVKAGLGTSVLPKWSIEHAIAANVVRAIRITRSGVFRKWYAASLSGVALTPFADEFIRLLVKHGPSANAKKGARRITPLAS